MKFYLEVYGCTTNQGDGASMAGILEEAGHERVDCMGAADILILVTCTVIATTEQRMLHRLKVFGETGKRIVVAGCMASAQAELIRKHAPSAEILGPAYLHHIAQLAEGRCFEREYRPKTGFRRFSDGGAVAIPIAEGCPFACAYCITKAARGKLVSYPREEIVRDVCRAVHGGCREIRLTAQDTAAYGMDCNREYAPAGAADGASAAEAKTTKRAPGITGLFTQLTTAAADAPAKESLSRLVKEVAALPGDFMVRVGMMNPALAKRQINELLDAYDSPKVYKFMHLPVQSGDDDVLLGMRRAHTPQAISRRSQKRFAGGSMTSWFRLI
ncbi:MAG: hypothetical protein CVT48_00610 [Thermoplasmata archaeon HGW-Thermoplasmata-1]|nr:MAG: hypothetical protein CVT48_00610 [Thermoplasmata archaeon HGW-Thermoplasmata-1]